MPWLEGDWEAVYRAAMQYRANAEAQGENWQDDWAVARHRDGISAILDEHITFPDGRHLCFMVLGGGSGIGIDPHVVADAIIGAFRHEPLVLKNLCEAAFQHGTCPIELSADLGVSIAPFEITPEMSVVRQTPHRDHTVTDLRTRLAYRSSQIRIIVDAEFQIVDITNKADRDRSQQAPHRLSEGYERLRRGFVALGLSRQLPVPISYSFPTTQYIGWTTAFGSSSSIEIRHRGFSDYIELTSKEIETAKSIFEEIEELKNDTFYESWTPATRLFSASSQHPCADSLIDLRIALESYFVGGKAERIRDTVSTRFAKICGGTLEEKKSTKRKVNKVYDWASHAVHNGTFPPKFDQIVYRDILTMYRNILLNSVNSGTPNWETFDLS